jgi:hypothetical protein
VVTSLRKVARARGDALGGSFQTPHPIRRRALAAGTVKDHDYARTRKIDSRSRPTSHALPPTVEFAAANRRAYCRSTRTRCSTRNHGLPTQLALRRRGAREPAGDLCALHKGSTRGLLDVLAPEAKLSRFVPHDPDEAGGLIQLRGPWQPDSRQMSAVCGDDRGRTDQTGAQARFERVAGYSQQTRIEEEVGCRRCCAGGEKVPLGRISDLKAVSQRYPSRVGGEARLRRRPLCDEPARQHRRQLTCGSAHRQMLRRRD